MADGPWSNYAPADSSSEGPWTKYAADEPKAAAWGPSSDFKGSKNPMVDTAMSYGRAIGHALRSEGEGIVDPLVGIGQAVAHVVGQGDKADAFVQNREKTIAAERAQDGATGTDGFRLAGNIMAPTNYVIPGGAGANALTRIGTAAATGASVAAMQPVTSGNFLSEKGKQAGLGALTAGGSTAVGELAAKAIKPALEKGAQWLMDSGVTLTPGQMKGGSVRRAEEAAKSVPVLGTAIRKAEGRAIGDFNTATINKALEPIGVTLPKGTAPGHDAIAAGQGALSQAYDTLLPKLKFGLDSDFVNDLTRIRTSATEMPEAQAKQLESILQNRLGTRLAQGGQMDGATLKQVQGELSMLSRNYKSSADAAQRDLGHALDDVNSSMRDALERQNPADAPALRKINNAYAMFTRVEGAASRRATSAGVFTPSDLLQAIKTQDKSVRKRAFSAGDGLLQDWAQNAHEVLGNKLPDSGTTERGLWELLGGAGVAGTLGHPAVAGGLALAAAPAMMYSKTGMNLLREFANHAPATRNHLSQLTRNALPQLAAPAGAMAPALLMGPNQ